MNQQDEKVLEAVGLKDIPDNEKKAVLAMIDQRLEKRFLANLLMSLDDDKRQMLESKIDEVEEPKIDDVVRIALDIQPDAPKILADSAGEVMTELKEENGSKAQSAGSPNTQPATAEDLPPVGANVPASAEANVPPENSQGPGISQPTQSPQQPYNLDDTLRQGANKSGDYYQP